MIAGITAGESGALHEQPATPLNTLKSDVGAAAVNNRSLHLQWIDALKGIALLWIVTNHVIERIFGSEYLGNPSFSWPPLAQRIAQLAPLGGHSWVDVPVNVIRYVGWTGDTGVGLFLIVSGFGLTYALARAGVARLDVADFYKRRALRIVPLWWGVHIFFALTWLLTGWGIEFTHKGMWLSMLGVRFTPGLFTYF
ncbi:MAG TPA: acyltransferase family protein, partial [Patescibacteria group bacterium]|nr:acyltransferase family protein [Patescibacteria group bacterium]